MSKLGCEADIPGPVDNRTELITVRAVDTLRTLAMRHTNLLPLSLYRRNADGVPTPPFAEAIVIEPSRVRLPKAKGEPTQVPGVALTVEDNGPHAYEGFLFEPNGKPGQLEVGASFELAVAGLSYTLGLLRQAATHLTAGDYATWAVSRPFAVDQRPPEKHGQIPTQYSKRKRQ